jgi:superfamily II DNA/RNA helicase
MRMVCDSTYLIDDTTSESPKMEILKEILFEKIDLHHSDRKIIIFSEWIKVHKLIGQILRENRIGFVELTGKVPVALRGELIKKFESRPECQIFLSTEAGGSGLNLQVADILINFELPWNPARKNQRIGRIDRLGQKSEKLTIYNFVTRNSIEQQIAAGLLVKQDLFEGVLDSDSSTNYVDFSSKGRSQFIKQLEMFLDGKPFDEEPAEKPADSPSETVSNDLSRIELIEDLNDDDTKPEEDLIATIQEEKTSPSEEAPSDTDSNAAEMEQVMNNGMQFLAGLFKMSTGKDMGLENQKIEIDKETGEVVMRFKMKF